MKAFSHPCWNTPLFLHKLCTGCPRSTCCLSQAAHSYSTGDFPHSSFCRTQEQGKESLPLRSNFRSHHSNVLLSLKNYGLHKHSNIFSMQRTTGLHTLPESTVLRGIFDEGSLKGLNGRNNLTLFRRWSRSSRSDRDDEERADDDKLEHRYMMERFASENDKLSRFRNTYIMTLVSLASIQLEISQIPSAIGAGPSAIGAGMLDFITGVSKLSQIPSAIGAVAIVTAELNLAFGTIIYISNMLMFRRTGRLLGTSFSGRVLFAVVHFVLWSLLLTLLFPDGDRIDEELKRYAGEEK